MNARKQLEEFSGWLLREEKSSATREKYLRDIASFYRFIGQKGISKEAVLRGSNGWWILAMPSGL